MAEAVRRRRGARLAMGSDLGVFKVRMNDGVTDWCYRFCIEPSRLTVVPLGFRHLRG